MKVLERQENIIDLVNDYAGIIKNLRRLDDIAMLAQDWDGYGAKNFSPEVVAMAKSLVVNLKRQPEIYPTGRGSIQFEYHADNDKYLELELFHERILIMKVMGNDYDNAQCYSLANASDTPLIINEIVAGVFSA